jgi:hypothetical protein
MQRLEEFRAQRLARHNAAVQGERARELRLGPRALLTRVLQSGATSTRQSTASWKSASRPSVDDSSSTSWTLRGASTSDSTRSAETSSSR